MATDGHLNFDTKIDEKGFSGGVKKLGHIAKGGLKVLGTAVAGTSAVMGAGLAMGMKYNSSMENYITNFEVLLGSAKKAQEHVADLKEFAAKTPFEMSDLADASKTLLSFGNDVDKVMPVMKELGDISLGNKEKFSSLALVYGQVSSQGKLMGQDLLQMINAGFNPLLEISEHTGESMTSLKEKMSQGQIGIEEIDQALKWATESGGRFAGGMEKASQTMSGQISTLKDNAMALIGEVVQPISQSVSENLLPAALGAIEQLTTAFREGGTEGLLMAGGQMILDLITGMDEALPSILDKGWEIITFIGTGIINALPALMETAVNIVNTLANRIAASAPTLIPKGIALIAKLAHGILNNLPAILNAGLKIVKALATGIINSLPTLIEQVPKLINSFCAKLDSFIFKLIATGLQLIVKLGVGMIKAIPTLLKNAGQILLAILNVITHFSLFSQGKNLIKGLGSGIKNMFGSIKTKMTELIGFIKNPFKIDWSEIGKNVITGIKNGIKNGVGALKDAVKNAAKSALDAAKNFLGIHSPSTVFRDQVGKYMALGMGKGFEMYSPDDEITDNLQKLTLKAQESAVPTKTVTEEDGVRYKPVPDGDDDPKDKPVNITVVTEIDGEVVAKKTVEHTDKELARRQALEKKGAF